MSLTAYHVEMQKDLDCKYHALSPSVWYIFSFIKYNVLTALAISFLSALRSSSLA